MKKYILFVSVIVFSLTGCNAVSSPSLRSVETIDQSQEVDSMLRDNSEKPESYSNEKFDIMIQAGQSNSEGYGFGTDDPWFPNRDVLYLTSDMNISMAKEVASRNLYLNNFSLSFAKEYIKSNKLQSGRKLLILRAAVNGTGFSDNRWGINDDLFLKMMEMTETALALNPENKLVAFLWHQGETDALYRVSYDTHYENLTTLVNTVRSTFKCEDLPFIAGDFVQQWKTENITICEPVVNAIEDVCKNTGKAKFIETNELQSNHQKLGNGDTIHFSKEALDQLGIRYFNAFNDIISNQ